MEPHETQPNNTHSPSTPRDNFSNARLSHDEDEKNLRRQAAAEDELSRALAEEKQVPQNQPAPPTNQHPFIPHKRQPATPHITPTSQNPRKQVFQIDGVQKKNPVPSPKITEPETKEQVLQSPFKKKPSTEQPASVAEKLIQNSTPQKQITESPSQKKETSVHPQSPQHSEHKAPVKPEKDQVEPEHGYTPNPKLQTLRTFRGDMASAAKDKGESVTSIAVAAHKKEEDRVKPVSLSTKEETERLAHSLPEKQPLKKEPIPEKLRSRKAPDTKPHTPHIPHRVPQMEPEKVQRDPIPQHLKQPLAPQKPIPSVPKQQIPTPAKHATMPAITRTDPKKNEAISVKSAASIPFFKNSLLILVSLVLIGGASFALYSIFVANKISNTEVALSQPETLIGYDTYNDLSLSSINTIEIQKTTEILSEENGSIAYAYTDLRPDTLLPQLTPSMPDILARSLKKPYAIGYYRDAENPIFFMTLTVEDFGQAFSGMLNWEQHIYEALEMLIPSEAQEVRNNFVDSVVENKDVRKLIGTQESTLLVYGFIDNTTLVIAENEAVFRGVANNILIKRSTR